MKEQSRFLFFMQYACLLAAVGLVVYGVWDYWTIQSNSQSGIKHGFADSDAPSKLKQLKPYEFNRLIYQFTNTTRGRARIVGNNFC